MLPGQQELTFGKHKGKTFDEAFLDQSYVGWCCGHMDIGKVDGNQFAWLSYLSTKMAEEEERLDEAEQRAESSATSVTGTSQPRAATVKGHVSTDRITLLEDRVASLEGMLSRMLN